MHILIQVRDTFWLRSMTYVWLLWCEVQLYAQEKEQLISTIEDYAKDGGGVV